MSIAPGYVHISVRNAQRTQRSPQHGAAQQGASQQSRRTDPAEVTSPSGASEAFSEQAASAPAAVMAESGQALHAVRQDNAAQGFVLYLGLDEETAASHGTSLAKLAQDIRAYAHSLVPQAQSYAVVAVAPAGTPGSPLDVVRSTFGDPTITQRRRQEPRPASAPVNRPPGVLIDLARREVHLDGEALNLTFKEFELLNYLVENAVRTVAREELLEGLWRNADEVPNERTIDVHIRRLRSKLGRLANTVRTVRGEGYRFYEHPEVVVWTAPEYSI
ncbi:winged helix-turn-helix domain-containing protein [Acaricomes phytoseiuli]|uniref:winged helix-turn-helix domain-containing protein n=1 Tax=Acaricomes phytoseiuli TaxID=291968 RepID=UPI0022239FE7|nr:winged helix-turn-helix domain-containing protein [Acaricomes phytoseiuli]MCW1249912.1 winged helix-turn-helix domain-containing protein [Acaricomes phytoseiuli]